MKRHRLLPGLCLALAAATSVHAQPPQGQPPQGQPPGRPDGPPPPGRGLFISPCGEPFRGPEAERAWFDGADADHDGTLTLAEFRADAMRFFKVLDANKDGVIDGLETRAYETRIAPEIVGSVDREDAPPRMEGPPGGRGGDHPRRRDGGQGMSRREGAARFGLLNEPQPVRGADADLDWKVTAEEWAKAAARRFALLDPQQSGRLILADLPPPGGGQHKPPQK